MSLSSSSTISHVALGRVLVALVLTAGLANGSTQAAEAASQPAAGLTSLPAPAEDGRTVDTGYVFIGGEYVPAPYHVQQTEEGVLINGHLIKADQFPRFNAAGRGGFAGPGRAAWQEMHQEGSRQGAGRAIFLTRDTRRPVPFGGLRGRTIYRLEQEAAIFALDDRPLVVLDSASVVNDLLRIFAGLDQDSSSLANVLAALPREADADFWKTWLTTYEPPPQLVARAKEKCETSEAVETANHEQLAAVRRLDTYSYPLSVFGMVLAVLASGHLLKSVPTSDAKSSVEEPRPHLVRFVIMAAGLVFLMSSLDLAWTLLAAQAGQMRELNPLGQNLIDDPASLVAFKLSATLVSCGLLVALRRHHAAQLASWWLCLVCTMLTFRWLLFNSMFLGS
jgi:hypothetical protein